MAKIVVTKNVSEVLVEKLKGGEHHVVVIPDDQSPAFYEKFAGEIKDAEGLITSKIKIDEAFLKSAPQLKIVSDTTVGYDNFELRAMKQHGVIGTHTPSVLDETVADLTFSLILSSSRRVAELDHVIREGGWVLKDDPSFYGSNVHHKTLGIIGMGRIGEKIARRAIKGFEMKVLYYNRHPKPDVEAALGVQYTPFDELLEQSDFVVMMTPLTDKTYHLIDTAALKKMKSSAFFINMSRGQTVDESALIHALQTGEIKGAGLDVYEQEPINPDNPLLKLKNVTLLPHIGSAVTETRFDMENLAVENILGFFKDGSLKTPVPELKSLLD